jgi:hypothetical protein
VHRRTVGQYSVEVRTLRAPSGVWKAAYIVEPAIHAGPRDFVMITLLDEFEDERVASTPRWNVVSAMPTGSMRLAPPLPVDVTGAATSS